MDRGEIVRIPSPCRARGHEQRGSRPGVVVQADELLALSTVLIVPTSQGAAPATFRPLIEVAGKPTRVLADQLRVFDSQTVKGGFGRLAPGEMEALEEALALVLGLRI